MDLQLTVTTDSANPVAGDLHLDGAAGVHVTGREAIAQHLRQRLSSFRGEWFLDTRVGVPYFRDVLGQSPSNRFLRSLFRQVILGTPGVTDVTKLSISVDTGARTLTVDDWEVTTTDGTSLSAADYGPLIVES